MKKSASVAKSSNQYNNSTLTTSSRTTRNKFGSKTISRFDKVVTNKQGQVVGTTSSIQKQVTLNTTSGIIGSTFGLIFTLLVLINFWNVLNGSAEFRGVEWLLNILSNAPSIPLDWLENWSAWSIDATSWGAFAFLANLLNRFIDFLNLIAFLGVGVINVLTFILYFISAFLYMGI